MTIPARLWENFNEFRILKEFAENTSVCNDVAEKGVAMINSYIKKAESEDLISLSEDMVLVSAYS